MRPFGSSLLATRLRTTSASFRSVTTPISTGKLRPISFESMSMWISLVGGMLNVNSLSHELQSASAKRVPRPMIQSAERH